MSLTSYRAAPPRVMPSGNIQRERGYKLLPFPCPAPAFTAVFRHSQGSASLNSDPVQPQILCTGVRMRLPIFAAILMAGLSLAPAFAGDMFDSGKLLATGGGFPGGRDRRRRFGRL